jgi:Protein kinase domain
MMAPMPTSTWHWPRESPSSDSSRSATPRAMAPPTTVPRTPHPISSPSPVHSDYGGYAQRSRELPSPEALENMLLTPKLIEELKLCFPGILSRQHWDRPTAQMCYIWSLKNPRTALALYMTHNISAWPVAAIFSPLSDDQLPHDDNSISSVVPDSQPFLDMQYRVMVRNIEVGDHIEFRDYEILPFQSVDPICAADSGQQMMDKVRYHGDGRLYARKSVVFARPAHKAILWNEIRAFKRLQHPNIAKIVCSYAQGNTMGLIMYPLATCNMEEYLKLPFDHIRPDLMRGWFVELADGLEYIHSMDLRHRNIKPSKILIEGDRVLYAGFNISKDMSNIDLTSTSTPVNQLSDDSSLMYAAPEMIHRNKRFRSTDVFALGCIFLEMMTVMKQHTVEEFREFRTTDGSASFHVCLEKVKTWAESLERLPRGAPRDDIAVESMALSLIMPMVEAEHSKRPKSRALASSFGKWNTWRSANGHGDLGLFFSDRWGELRALDSFYSKR